MSREVHVRFCESARGRFPRATRLRQRIELRYPFIEKERKAYPVVVLCEVLRVSRSAYYAWRNRGETTRQQANTKLLPLVRDIHRESRGTYGTRRMSRELQERDVSCGRQRARTLMRLAGVAVKTRRKFKATTDSGHKLPVAPNLLERDFEAAEPNQVWVSDITYLWTSEGWLYLAVVLDLFSRSVVGWSMGSRMTRHLVIDALQMAYWRRRPMSGLVFHSDRGSQYCSNDFQKLLMRYGMRGSMSRKGDCWDNAVAESFFGSLKTERVYLTKYATRIDARRDVIDYIEMFYNSTRSHSFLDYMCPQDFEKSWLSAKAA